MADSGYNIQHLPTASQLGIQNQRTSDLLVEGLGRVDVITPITNNQGSIITGITKKNNQATTVLVQKNLSQDEMTTITNRIWGKKDGEGKNINLIIFQDETGKLFNFKRP